MFIRNYSDLAISEQRKQVLYLIEEGIAAVHPKKIIPSKLRYNPTDKILTVCDDTYDLSEQRLFIIGGGKAAGSMAEAIEEIIPTSEITAGIVNCNSENYNTKKIKINPAGHPIPDQSGVAGVNEMLNLKDKYSIDHHDIVLCFISGGGSALMPAPIMEITLEDKQIITDLLIRSGANIQEINIVRSHLSKIKGGRLAKHFAPATVIALIISDVPGNDLSAVASGPTVNDSSTYNDATSILNKYKLESKTPSSIIKYFKNAKETSQQQSVLPITNVKNYLLADNKLALSAMMEVAQKNQLNPLIITSELTGETGNMAKIIANDIIVGKYSGYNLLLFAGETTPAIPEKSGAGGRNQHYIASSLMNMKEYDDKWVAVSVASDGTDFIPEVAGAIIDSESAEKVDKLNIDVQSYLKNFDSNSLLKKIGNCIIESGPTGTNIGDIIIYLIT
jgi:hydroxypyruvate reductase/glycerate 2-kinase